MHSFCYFGPSKVIQGGKQMFMGFNGPFSLIMDRKENKYVLWEYIYELWTSQRKIPSLGV